MKKLSIISLAVLAFSLQSCRKDYLYVAPAAPPVTTPVSFSSQVYPLFATASSPNYCGGCHDGSGSALNFSGDVATAYASLPTYVTAGSATTSLLYQSIATGTNPNGYMPMGSTSPQFSPEEIEILKAWINQGALNN